MKIREIIKKILFIEIMKGLALTFRTMLKPPVTRRYPKEKREPFPGFRGRHAFVRDSKTNKEKCVACLRCASVCPSKCIYIDFTVNENGSRTLKKYEIESLRCVFCGYCATVCPVCALVLTEVYEYADYSRESFYYDRERLLSNWDEFAAMIKNDTYFNKFWRLDGIDIKRLPVGKRLQEPVVIKKWSGDAGNLHTE